MQKLCSNQGTRSPEAIVDVGHHQVGVRARRRRHGCGRWRWARNLMVAFIPGGYNSGRVSSVKRSSPTTATSIHIEIRSIAHDDRRRGDHAYIPNRSGSCPNLDDRGIVRMAPGPIGDLPSARSREGGDRAHAEEKLNRAISRERREVRDLLRCHGEAASDRRQDVSRDEGGRPAGQRLVPCSAKKANLRSDSSPAARNKGVISNMSTTGHAVPGGRTRSTCPQPARRPSRMNLGRSRDPPRWAAHRLVRDGPWRQGSSKRGKRRSAPARLPRARLYVPPRVRRQRPSRRRRGVVRVA